MARKKHIVKDRQTLIDIAMQLYGCYEGVFVLMEDNDINEVAFEPEVDSELYYNSTPIRLNSENKKVVKHYQELEHIVISSTAPSGFMEVFEFNEGEEDEPLKEDPEPLIEPSAEMFLELQTNQGQAIPNGSIVTDTQAYQLNLRVVNTGNVAIYDMVTIELPVETKVDGGDGTVNGSTLKFPVRLGGGTEETFNTTIHFEANDNSNEVKHKAIMAVANSNETVHPLVATPKDGDFVVTKSMRDQQGNDLPNPYYGEQGDIVEFVITILKTTEGGPVRVSGFDILDSNLIYQADSSGHNTYDSGAHHVYFSADVDFNVPEEVKFFVKVDENVEDGTIITNTASVTYRDFTYESQQPAATIVVNEEPTAIEVNMQKGATDNTGNTLPPVGLLPGDEFRYTFDFENLGDAPFTGNIIDDFPDEFDYIFATQDGGQNGSVLFNYNASNHVLTMNTTIPVGESVSGILQMRVKDQANPGAYPNNFTYSYSDTEGVDRNDVSTISVVTVRAIRNVNQTKFVLSPDGTVLANGTPLIKGEEYVQALLISNDENKARGVNIYDVLNADQYDFAGAFSTVPAYAQSNTYIDVDYNSGTRTVSKTSLTLLAINNPDYQPAWIYWKVKVPADTVETEARNIATGSEN